MTTSTTGPNADRRKHGRAGFTLLELVLVMVVICTVLAMAAPSLRGFFASRQTDDAAARIVALTRLARSLAVTEGRVYRLNLDCEAGTYWLTAQQEGAFRRLSTEFGRVFLLPEGATADLRVAGRTAGARHVAFYPSGRTEAATVRLSGRRGDIVEVTCQSPTELFAMIEPATGGHE